MEDIKTMAAKYAEKRHDENSCFFDVAFKAYIEGYLAATKDFMEDMNDDDDFSCGNGGCMPTDNSNQ
jgi:hypothetical protein